MRRGERDPRDPHESGSGESRLDTRGSLGSAQALGLEASFSPRCHGAGKTARSCPYAAPRGCVGCGMGPVRVSQPFPFGCTSQTAQGLPRAEGAATTRLLLQQLLQHTR